MSTSYQPWYAGATSPAWDIPLTTDGSAEDLTGVNASDFTMIFRNTSVAPVTDQVGTGTFAIKSINPGEVIYKPSVADVASAFSGLLYVHCNFPPSHSTADLVIYDPISFVISAD